MPSSSTLFSEYIQAAEHLACRGFEGDASFIAMIQCNSFDFKAEGLNISLNVEAMIENNPKDFAKRVAEAAYSLVWERAAEKDN